MRKQNILRIFLLFFLLGCIISTVVGKKAAGENISRAGLTSMRNSSVTVNRLNNLMLIGSEQPAFRVRSDFAAGLNSDQGWAGAINENVTIYADQPFRIRFEVALNSRITGRQQFRLQYKRNEGDWINLEAQDFPHPESKTPRVSIVSCAAYKNGENTTDLLRGWGWVRKKLTYP